MTKSRCLLCPHTTPPLLLFWNCLPPLGGAGRGEGGGWILTVETKAKWRDSSIVMPMCAFCLRFLRHLFAQKATSKGLIAQNTNTHTETVACQKKEGKFRTISENSKVRSKTPCDRSLRLSPSRFLFWIPSRRRGARRGDFRWGASVTVLAVWHLP